MNGSSCCKRSKFMPKNPKGSRFWIFGRWTSVLLYYMVKSGKTLKDEPWQQAREHELWNRVDFLASFHVRKNTLQKICESLVVSILSAGRLSTHHSWQLKRLIRTKDHWLVLSLTLWKKVWKEELKKVETHHCSSSHPLHFCQKIRP